MSNSSRSPRLWPALVVVGTVALALAATWLRATDSSEQIRQDKVVQSGLILVLACLVLVVWAVGFSRLAADVRFKVVGALLAVVIAFPVLFRYRGVSGDLVPQFELRFRTPSMDLPSVALDSLPGAKDYPQFLGPNRNGTLAGIHLARDWSSDPPELVWRRPVGRGWSGFAVSGNHAVTQEQHSAEERVVSYELSTGRVEWASREVAHYENALAGEGPRATPTIEGGRVYAMGATGLLTALDLETGSLLFKRDVLEDAGAELPTWGKSDSPLVVDGVVIVHAGGRDGRSLLAYDAFDGSIVWHGGDDSAAYSSPFLVTLAGRRQVVSLHHASVSGHDPRSGEVLWRHPWPDRQPNVSQPLVLPEDRLLVSAGYGVGSKLFRIAPEDDGRLSVELLWESQRLKAKFTNLVYHDGYVYGLDDGILVCLDPEAGRRRWKRGRYGHGQVLLVDELLLVQGEHGEIVLVEPDPDEHRELTRFRVMDGKIWNPPALAGRYLLVRNDAEAALFGLPVREPAKARSGPVVGLPPELKTVANQVPLREHLLVRTP